MTKGPGHFGGKKNVVLRTSGSFISSDDTFDEGVVLELVECSFNLALRDLGKS